jgi:acetyltransferase-like isoleucine patch superfamily enzyme
MNDSNNLSGEEIKQYLAHCGINVTIYPFAKIIKPEVIKIGDHSRIDDFTFVYGGNGIELGRYVHFSCFGCVVGGGELFVGDYVSIGYGTKIITGTDDYHGGKRMSTALPLSQRNVIRGKIVIEKDAFIGANSVIHPNVRIGEGAIIGSNSLVLHDVAPWTISVGSPCKVIKNRPRLTVPDI